MKIGFIISMYDEIETVQKTIVTLKQYGCPIIIIQSDPKDPSKIIDENQVDFYQKLSDLAGSKEEYIKERTSSKEATTPVKAVTRNYQLGFSMTKSFHVDYWVAILGDVLITSMTGIEEIIQKMNSKKKSLAITRAVGQTFMDNDDKPTRIQTHNTTDFMPQFFIAQNDPIQNGLFSKFTITNRFATEQCLGDEVIRYCTENNTDFHTFTFTISDYAYPQFISGLKYNPDRISMPRYVDGFVNMMRRLKTNHSK
ncbi:hypothetical protein [Nitrosopumilus sp. b2]|uniref:hypothetical protein n=1 Tax=Nitrosopumilus sp. b2 TaxID=2109908 RepID=UPI0015F55291|nr:hypothetical protein [Nitrosopumilus sp. b2]